jgi:hypothetical protein
MLLAIAGLNFAALVQLNFTFEQPQGRYLFPALTAFMVLIAMGFHALPWGGRAKAWGLLVILLGVNLYALVVVEIPSYWKPSTQTEEHPGIMVSDAAMTSTAGPLSDARRFAQSFVSDHGNFNRIELEIATYRRVVPFGTLTLRLRDAATNREVASTVVPANTIKDCSYVALTFPPIANSRNRSYYLIADVAGLSPGYDLTVFLSKGDVYPEGTAFLNNSPLSQDTSFRTYWGTAGCPSCLLQSRR